MPISYIRMIGKELGIDTYISFLAIVDPYGKHFLFSTASRYYTKDMFLVEDETIENIHPYAFIAKFQTHGNDNPTYTDILRGLP